ncbi:MAG: metallophosphoesterase [Deltaproteobacteria bacterium]|nr:metallophosphoesterase [Deltaproteobacteria bacterium]
MRYGRDVSRLVELPDEGRMIVATDLQGNLTDFDRVARIFEEAAREPDGAVLVVTGDLVHGPEIPERHWPDYLGSYFQADSVGVVDRAEALARKYPGRVHYLLGNHGHAHVGGPVVSKFFANEALRLEQLLGAERTVQSRNWIQTWPLVAVARQAGLLMLHGAPNALIHSPADLDAVELSPEGGPEGVVDDLLAELLWARTASTVRARAFMNVIDSRLRVAVFGHDVVRGGFAIDREPLLCISTSFGCHDGDKLYLDWDLSRPASSAAEAARDGLRPLYPDSSPVYRRAAL